MGGATGVTSLLEHVLNDDSWAQIKEILTGQRIEVADLKPFRDALGGAVGVYQAYRKLSEESRPGAMKDNLKSLLKVAQKLSDGLDKLDGNSRQILDRAAAEGLQAFRRDARDQVVTLNRALRSAAEYRERGRLDENERLFLAVEVAAAIKKHLDRKPTTTKQGLFEAVLSIVMTEAIGKKDPVVHSLVQRAFSCCERRESLDGAVEYVPKG